MTSLASVENGSISPEDDMRMHVEALLAEQRAAGADPEILADIGYKAPEPGINSPAENIDIAPEDIDRMHRGVAAFLQEQVDAGADSAALEDVGYHDIPEANQPEEAPTLKERAEAAILSGKLIITNEISPPKATGPEPRTKQRKPAKRGASTSSKLLAVRDRAVGDSKKPWPYGSKED